MNEKKTILIVEDDKYIVNFMSMTLKDEGYGYYVAKSVKEAISLFYANQPDMILLDLGLPDCLLYTSMQKGTKKQKNTSSVSLKMVIGGAFQGKRKFAEQTYGNIQWADGADCPEEALYTCGGIFHFEEYIKRRMKKGDNLDGLVHSIAERSPGLVRCV